MLTSPKIMDFISLKGLSSMFLQLKIFVFGLLVNINQNKQYEKYLNYDYGKKNSFIVPLVLYATF